MVDLIGPLELEVDECSNGKEALLRVAEKDYSAILCDMMMPEMSGIEFFEHYRMQNRRTPFIFLTGFGDRDRILQALRLGAFDFIDKPFDFKRLFDVCQRAVEAGYYTQQVEAIQKSLKDPKYVPTSEELNKIQLHEKMASLLQVKNFKKST